eukprot:CAMPEP_0201522500 /NCGR_PEP_ID=MMETSP0161_2-20130828/17762_1 /ASSEMBLY_ACC=CAM_ASM_000251 /TAXON_ID=180227 /ORGANISM="Neoparamoeba aestuarina, Strain SoJaBio B1-5/56/2" /LENGTH=226 /DNA_ID=CAMNT_0047921359 /DNA_START=102 /DNA_END=782 /DNA_ORIENTATION=+
MELFVANVRNVAVFQDSDGSFLDINEWEGLQVIENGTVEVINHVSLVDLKGGYFDFACLPRKIVKVCIAETGCAGTVSWKELPDSIKYFTLGDDAFYGTVDLTALPTRLYTFCLEYTQFSGTLDFSSLPPDLVLLHLAANKFEGRIDLRSISRNICGSTSEHLSIEFEMLEPRPGMEFSINLAKNNFDGDIFVKDVDKVAVAQQFEELMSEYLVDDKGGRKPCTET